MERLLPSSSTYPPGIHLSHFAHANDANCDTIHLRHSCYTLSVQCRFGCLRELGDKESCVSPGAVLQILVTP